MKGSIFIGLGTHIKKMTNLINSYSASIEMNGIKISEMVAHGFAINLIGSQMKVKNAIVRDISGSENTLLF